MQPKPAPDEEMSLLDHLDELRSRLFRMVVAYLIVFLACYSFADPIIEFLLAPIREHLFGGGEIVYINLTEPFFVKLKSVALVSLFIASPVLLYQLWAFVAPGLHKHEARLVVPFLVFGTLFFAGGGAFGYYVAVPTAARWLIDMGGSFKAAITLRSAFQFESWLILGLGAVFQMPIVIFFLSRVGLVTPQFLMKHFRIAVLIMVIASAVITPTGDWVTMSIFAGPMILLYLLGVFVAWVSQVRRARRKES